MSEQPIPREVLKGLWRQRQQALAAQFHAQALASAFDADLTQLCAEADVALEQWNFDLRDGSMVRKNGDES